MLETGQTAPDFSLPQFEGGQSRYYNLAGDSFLIFYKFSCPTCQFTLPFLQRIYDAYGDMIHFLAIAQDGPEETAEFRQRFSITIPTLLDMEPYQVSGEYGLISVPTMFLVDPDRKIRYAGAAFVKEEIQDLADIFAEKLGRSHIDVFAGVEVPEIKPG